MSTSKHINNFIINETTELNNLNVLKNNSLSVIEANDELTESVDNNQSHLLIRAEVSCLLHSIIDTVCKQTLNKFNYPSSISRTSLPSTSFEGEQNEPIPYIVEGKNYEENDSKASAQVVNLGRTLPPEINKQHIGEGKPRKDLKVIKLESERQSLKKIEEGGIPAPLWMPQPHGKPNCPYGLEYLTMVDSLEIVQSKFLPAFNEPSFIIRNSKGQYIYQVEARAKWIFKFFCASKRRYEMSILDFNHVEVMHFSRPHQWHDRRFLNVYAPFGSLIGRISEGIGPTPSFMVLDLTNEVLFRIILLSGPPDDASYSFGIMPAKGDSLVGKIDQDSGGMCKKFLRENFIQINYYLNLEPKKKALILGACFLIDLLYFEMF